MSSQQPIIDDIKFRVRDGLQLFARHYRAAQPQGRPVVCLPGLTRNGRDFHDLALHLSTHPSRARDVYALDYRGRGYSDWDDDWKNYTVPMEALDTLEFMTSAGLHQAGIIGTSRGGMIAMIMAAMQPSAIGPVVMNDIGPVIETDGIMRIAGYVGLIPLPRDWIEAEKLVRMGNQRNFPDISDEEWAVVARQWYLEKNGQPACGYDPKLKNALSVLDGPMPELWPQFEALTRMPVLVLRGENSDILSEETVVEMHRRHPMIRSVIVANQGHAPLLRDGATQGEIAKFLLETDDNANMRGDWGANAQLRNIGVPHHQAANDDERPAASVIGTILAGTTGG